MADEPGRTNLPRLSRLMAWCSAIGVCAVPLLLVATFFIVDMTGIHADFGLDFDHMGAAKIAETPLDFRVVAFLFALIPTGFIVWAFVSLRQLFNLYTVGDVFSMSALRMLNHVAAALFASVVTGIATQPPIALILSWYRGAGHRFISIGIGNQEIMTFFIAGSVLVIARVMAEARRMADENASFV